MGSSRFFSGSRTASGKGGAASKAMREQLKKGGTIDASENYKKMLKDKLNEAKLKAASGEKSAFSSFGGNVGKRPQRSKRAEETMKLMALQQQMKEEKKAKKAVVVEPKRLVNGTIDKKGRICDISGAQVGQINLKNGAITTIYGQHIGVYKGKSYMTHMAIQEAINKNSPYLINQRKIIEQQKLQNAPQFGGGFAQTEHKDIFGNEAGNVWGEPPRDIWGNIMTFFGFR